VEHGGTTYPFEVFLDGDRVDVEGAGGHVGLTRTPRFRDPSQELAKGSLVAPMPGTVVALHTSMGDEVVAGRPVLVIEAMKMQHTVTASYDGVVTELSVQPGDQVAAGAVLAVVRAHEDTDEQPTETGGTG